MVTSPRTSHVDEARLSAVLPAVAESMPGREDLVEALGGFVRTADDRDVVRINPIRFASERGLDSSAVVNAFLHGRKAGLFSMEWQYICPGCGDIVERLPSLTSATAHYYCQVCSADRDAELSDGIEITFSVSPEIRRSRFHDPWSLSPDDHFFCYRFSQSALVDDGTPLPDHLRKYALVTAYIEPGATDRFRVDAVPGNLWLTNGPALTIGEGRTNEVRSFAFEYTGVRSKGYRAEIDAGPVEIVFTNATADRYALLITMLGYHYDVAMRPFLSGSDLLSNQTFLDLFELERIAAGEGLTVQRLTLVFTDLQGSTALYEKVGDMKAFDLVTQHFGHLREVITRNNGALVKTIGDAVMASFVDPLDGLRAAVEMVARIDEFNTKAGGDLLALKVGVHSGACLAVTLNDRLDYFGQTVNIAARIQGLAGPGEIVVSDDVLATAGAARIVEGLATEALQVDLRGVAGPVDVHRIRAEADVQ
jgi:class 3 adenylate cyclase